LAVYIPAGETRVPSQIIAPGQTFTILKGSVPLDSYFASYVPSDTMEVFIYDVNTVKNTPWDSVVARYLVLKRYDLTIDGIKKMNGVLYSLKNSFFRYRK
jgi:hypothetical protein